MKQIFLALAVLATSIAAHAHTFNRGEDPNRWQDGTRLCVGTFSGGFTDGAGSFTLYVSPNYNQPNQNLSVTHVDAYGNQWHGTGLCQPNGPGYALMSYQLYDYAPFPGIGHGGSVSRYGNQIIYRGSEVVNGATTHPFWLTKY